MSNTVADLLYKWDDPAIYLKKKNSKEKTKNKKTMKLGGLTSFDLPFALHPSLVP